MGARAGTPPELPMAGAAPRTTWPPGQTTGGAFGLYRWDMGPRPSGPSPHFHRSITESFYVLTGAVRLHDGRMGRRRARGLLPRPDRRRHGFRNESGEPASMLLLFTPGAPREDYFETLADAARRDGHGRGRTGTSFLPPPRHVLGATGALERLRGLLDEAVRQHVGHHRRGGGRRGIQPSERDVHDTAAPESGKVTVLGVPLETWYRITITARDARTGATVGTATALEIAHRPTGA